MVNLGSFKCIYVQNDLKQLAKCFVIIRLLFGHHKLNSCLYRNKAEDVHTPICQMCDLYENETVEHLLFRCKKYDELRVTLWNEVLYHCPSESMYEYLTNMPRGKVTCLLLTGLNSTYTHEWSDFFTAILQFVYKMYITRTS